MRLINCRTLLLEWFADDTIPEYAILSHRWETEEVTFEDMRDPSQACRKKGFAKLQQPARIALEKHVLEYIWVDTCCIDKDSSAELSEAINSMYTWYKKSRVCLAYLSDVPGREPATASSKFGRSLWFTRGWTFQELIAPRIVEFYASDWNYCGTKNDLKEVISRITCIPDKVLEHGALEEYSIAQRMSWASDRKTTRVEDTAYCLFGIFDVNMPMIYGEGTKAFLRLQEEIIKRSFDQTIFCWNMSAGTSALLATSPTCFRDCSHMISNTLLYGTGARAHPYALINMGLDIRMTLVIWCLDTYVGLLGCFDMGCICGVGIFLSYKGGHYFRTFSRNASNILIPLDAIRHHGTIIDERTFSRNASNILNGIRHHGTMIDERNVLIRHGAFQQEASLYGFRIKRYSQIKESGAARREGSWGFDMLAHQWDPESGEASIREDTAGTVAVLFFGSGESIFVQLAFDNHFNPCCLVGHCDRHHLSTLDPTRCDMLQAYSHDGVLQSGQERFPKAPGREKRADGKTEAPRGRRGASSIQLVACAMLTS